MSKNLSQPPRVGSPASKLPPDHPDQGAERGTADEKTARTEVVQLMGPGLDQEAALSSTAPRCLVRPVG